MFVRSVTTALATVFFSVTVSNAGVSGAEPPAPPASFSARLAWPGGARADLVVPDTLWAYASSRVHRVDRPLGFTPAEMAGFGRDALILRPVRNLFGDVRGIHRFSGKAAEDLVANAANPAEMVLRAFGLTDVAAGRNLPMPDSASWGVDWIPRDATARAALDAVLTYEGQTRPGQISEADRRQWDAYPDRIQRLVIRIMVGAADATPWIRKAYADPVFSGDESGAVGAGSDTAAVMSRYRFATAPWVDARLDQSATLSRASLEALSRLDRDYLAFGSMIFLVHLQNALAEYRTAEARDPGAGSGASAEYAGCRFQTALGRVCILGSGADTVVDPAFLTVDLGGDDHYLGRHGVPVSLDQPIGVVLDLGGADTYEGGSRPVSLGCGLFGLGGIFDLAGDDHYRCAEAGLGAGIFGTGLVVDYAGNDTYMLDTHHGQGSALAGVGLLIDLAGDDAYTCGYSAQGFGETLGAGLLVDVAGNDTYLARDDGNPSALYNNQSVSMAQGVGQGRRADLGDGHSFAGGIGFLVDGAGDDSYHASAWSQGAGYWWAAGFLEDLGGNDRYRNGKYSLGAAAHFAVGCQVDLSGDDRHNVGNEAAVNQYQGHARDGSIGISIDGDGNDEYYLRSHCGGSGDLDAIGFFWDRRGDDAYRVRYEMLGPANGWADTPPMGTATVYTPFRAFRDDMDAIGLFIDSGGRDAYTWAEADSVKAADRVPAAARPAENREWSSRRGVNSWGFGIDIEALPSPGR